MWHFHGLLSSWVAWVHHTKENEKRKKDEFDVATDVTYGIASFLSWS